MNAFISHNKADKMASRHLAVALVEQGVGVWFDEWEIRPGDSIVGGIEVGLSDAEVFVLVWSSHARDSNWVGTELRAYLRRRVDDQSLKIVPIMLDQTPLPTLVAEYKGFVFTDTTPEEIATEIAGNPGEREVARLLQSRLFEVAWDKFSGSDPFPYFVCPSCGCPKLRRFQARDARGDSYYCVQCEECNWREETEIP